MSPLRPTTTSAPRAAARAGISPIGVMLCTLATLVTVPVALSLSSEGSAEEVAVVAVESTVSASDLEADVDVEQLFDAGARVDDVPDVPVTGVDDAATDLAAAIVADPERLIVADVAASPVAEAPAAAPQPVTSTTISEAPATAAPVATEPPTTAAPTTAPPTTEAPTTAAPTTAPPTTEAPTTEAPAPEVEQPVENPQGAEPEASAAPTAEQWAALRACESSGNYSIVSPNGLYHGAYQFYQLTWDGLARQLGRSDLVGLAPSQAAPADQDALALLLWQQRGNQPWPHCGRHLPAAP